MKHASPHHSNITYLAGLVNSGFQGAVSVGRQTLGDQPVGSALLHSVRQSWKPAAIGACVGVLAGAWKRDPKLSSALRGGFVGSALGLAGGLVWNSRGATGAVVRGAVRNVNAARDERWLELNPIDYA